MPDADRIHTSLSRKYSKAYKQLCEWAWSKDDVGEEVIKPLLSDIKSYGNEPLKFILDCSSRLEEIASAPLFLPITNWLEELKKISNLRLQIQGNRRSMDLAEETVKELLHDFRRGKIEIEASEGILVHTYFSKIYQSKFEGIVPLTAKHYLDTPSEIIMDRLMEIRPVVEVGIEKLALQAVSQRNVHSLKFKPIKRRKKISLDDNIFDL